MTTNDGYYYHYSDVCAMLRKYEKRADGCRMEINKMKILNIGHTDIFLDDKGKGQGKITISDPFYGAFTHYWGVDGRITRRIYLQNQ